MSLLTTPITELLDGLFVDGMPRIEIAGVCLLRFAEAAPVLRDLLQRAADGTLQPNEEKTFFVGLHILAGGRDPLSFKPFLRLLRLPQDELEQLLGDALTELTSYAAAGMFDGDVEALMDMIADPDLDEFLRGNLLGALTFLTWDKRIDLDRTVRFLERFDDERLAAEGEFVWSDWEQSIALLGLQTLAPRVEAAFRDRRIDNTISDLAMFRQTLAEAKNAPDDIERFRSRHLGYIEDLAVALEGYYWGDDAADGWTGDGWPSERFASTDAWPAVVPASNPWRGVGRNDPCPCGSGKKFKKCCLDSVG